MASEKDKGEIITNRDLDVNALKALLKLIPGAGESIVQMLFERGTEAKWRRFERTLEEIRVKVDAGQRKPETDGNEDFADFLGKVAEPIASSTNEDKRQRFRDLLFNSMFVPPGDPGWQESMYCLDLLRKIDPVGLYILAIVDKATRGGMKVGLTYTSGPGQWLFMNPAELSSNAQAATGKLESLLYNQVLIKKEINALVAVPEMIYFQNQMVRLGNSLTGMNFMAMTDLGRMLVKWTVADF